jgi:hypothetical protein
MGTLLVEMIYIRFFMSFYIKYPDFLPEYMEYSRWCQLFLDDIKGLGKPESMISN